MDVVMQWNQRGQLRGLGGGKEGCQPADGILFLAGTGRTDGGGSWSLDVRKVLCPDVELGVPTWVALVATPSHQLIQDEGGDSLRDSPGTAVTTAWSASGGTATLQVRSWTCRCDPQPDVEFSFHAAISYVFVG